MRIVIRGEFHAVVIASSPLCVTEPMNRESSDREAILSSLARFRDVEIDLLVPWVAQKGAAAAPPYKMKEFYRDLDTVIARIEAGGDG